MTAACRLPVRTLAEAEQARRAGRSLAAALGFTPAEQETVALAIMELATNLVRYAVDGTIILRPLPGPQGCGVEVESVDAGPGIADLAQALTAGYSSGGGLGEGLGVVQRLMDEFAMTSRPQQTRIVAHKWPSHR